jgi:integrase
MSAAWPKGAACCGSAPSRPIERGIAGPGLLAHILVAKFSDHLPLYRQSVIYAREGVNMHRALLTKWVGAASALLRSLVDAIRRHVLTASKPNSRAFKAPFTEAARTGTYGLGAGEVIGLQLQDIDWNAGTLQMSRPKTGVNFVLPLLPPVAKVLARYLRHGRPPHTPPRHVFVQMKVPFGALTASSAVRHVLIKHAKVAGIQAPYLGSHVLRHSNAARQLDGGTKARVLSDLLGHRDPESVSAYVRIATQSLREVSLPVPR